MTSKPAEHAFEAETVAFEHAPRGGVLDGGNRRQPLQVETVAVEGDGQQRRQPRAAKPAPSEPFADRISDDAVPVPPVVVGHVQRHPADRLAAGLDQPLELAGGPPDRRRRPLGQHRTHLA